MRRVSSFLMMLPLLAAMAGCGDDAASGSGAGPGGRRAGGPGGPGGFGGPNGDPAAAAVPVEVAVVEKRSISAYIETNGTLEAENEVDIVARAAAPIVQLLVEEGDAVQTGQLLARLDETEFRAQLEIARVSVEEKKQAFERARRLFDQKLVSSEEFDASSSAYDSARAQFEASRIQMAYAEIRAPFGGLIVDRYVAPAQQVSTNQPIYRLSDFDPLLCPIQVPERELPRLRVGQRAWLEVDSWKGERFAASVLRISPIVDAATGTIKVTLDATSSRLRPGMFARVFLQAETREGALVIPKSALSLESIGDTVYVAAGTTASRREVELGFEEGNYVEVIAGVAEGEPVVVVGQDGLSEGTPIQILARAGDASTVVASGSAAPSASGSTALQAPAAGGPPRGAPPGGRGRPGGGPPEGFDPSQITPEQLERIKERMRARGMTDEEIEKRLKAFRERRGSE